MRLGIIIHSSEAETAWNAIRLGNYALQAGDDVRVFLVGPGVDAEDNSTDDFPVHDGMQELVDAGGQILACGTCLTVRSREGTELCPLSTMKDLYEIVRDSDRVVSF
jgi:sulfur relay (sulfurtransferase) complex TusBCD TusD component (DsrE family)